MKRRDPIVEELHKLRERIGRAHDFDADRIAATIRQHEREGGGVLLRATAKRATRRKPDSSRRPTNRMEPTDSGSQRRAARS